MFGNKIGHQLGLLRHRAQTPADIKSKATLALAHRRYRADIVDMRERTSLLGATGKRNLEFAAKLLRIGVA